MHCEPDGRFLRELVEEQMFAMPGVKCKHELQNGYREDRI